MRLDTFGYRSILSDAQLDTFRCALKLQPRRKPRTLSSNSTTTEFVFPWHQPCRVNLTHSGAPGRSAGRWSVALRTASTRTQPLPSRCRIAESCCSYLRPCSSCQLGSGAPSDLWPLLRTRTIEGFPEQNPSRQTDYQTYCVPAAYLTAAEGQRIEKRVEYN